MKLLGTTKTKQDITNAVLELASKKKQVIYGAQSTNIQLPRHLRSKTRDYDILTKKAEQSAKELANKLNKEYGNGFKVVQAIHKKTFKVKDKEGKTIADYTQTTKKPKSKLILGVRYAELEYQKKKVRKILKDEASKFRHEKDIETLRRIKSGERAFDW